MENIDKLMIITSPNGDEYGNFWKLGGQYNPIVKNGYEGDFKIVFESLEQEYFEKKAPDLSNHLVMVHFHSDETPNLTQRSYVKDNKSITYYLFFYSSLETQLNGDLWSIGDNYRYAGPMDSPQCPFDKLRMDIINGGDTSASVKEIINWVKSKISSTNIFDLKLDLLHLCLTPESAQKASDLPNYHLLKDIIVDGKLSVDDFIKTYLAHNQKDFSFGEHNEMLTVLRDALLKEEEQAASA